jgi:hypothetical protein
MPKTSILTQLAMAGIAAGLVSVTPALAVDATAADSAKPAMAPAKAKKATKKDTTAKAAAPATPAAPAAPAKAATPATPATPAAKDSAAKPMGKGPKMGKGEMKHDSAMAKHHAADSAKMGKMDAKAGAPKTAKHGCKGHNECKGQGGCAMTQKDLDAAAKKLGVPVEKAGKPHSCKGMNECKGLGGCKMM